MTALDEAETAVLFAERRVRATGSPASIRDLIDAVRHHDAEIIRAHYCHPSTVAPYYVGQLDAADLIDPEVTG